MTCELCLSKETFQPGLLLSTHPHNYTCKKCSSTTALISKFVPTAHQLYHIDLQRKFNRICPTFIDGHLIVARSDLIKMDGFDAEEVIKDLVIRFDLIDTKYSDKVSINDVCNKLMGYLIHQLSEMVEQSPKGYIISLMNALEYNLYLTNTIVVWLNDTRKNMKNEDIQDNFGRIIVQSLQFQKDHDYFNKFNSIYKEWESVLSLDKLALQYGIELINYTSSKMNNRNEKFNSKIYGNIFSLIRAIYTILHEKDTVLENLKEGQELIIDRSGMIHAASRIKFNTFAEAYVNGMVNRTSNEIPDNIREQFDTTCKAYIGITHSELSEFARKLPEFYPHTDEFIVGSKTLFKELFRYILRCSDSEAEKALSLFINMSQTEFQYATSTRLRNNRPLRRCILEIEDEILTSSIQLLSYSAMAMYMDIIEGTLPESDFQKSLFKITSKLHENFELQVTDFLKEKFQDAICSNNIPKDNAILNIDSNGFVSLSGQIDVLFFYKNKLLLIECKDAALKFSAKAMGNEVNKFRKINKNSYQNKLNNKIQEAYNNWNSLMNYLGISDRNIEKQKPLGLFVTSTFSPASLEENLLFPVIPLSKLEDWIKQNF